MDNYNEKLLTNLSGKDKNINSPYIPREATIIRTEMMTESEKFFEIELDDGLPLGHLPGQFIMLSLFGYGNAPISISSSPTKEKRNVFEICVRKVGTFTIALHKLEKNDKIGVLGPFGTAFPIDELKGNDLLFVAGGLGIIPLRSLIHFALDRRRDFGDIKILIGCKTPGDLLFVNEMEKWSKMVDITYNCAVDKPTPDWKGNVGVITTLIPGIDINPFRTYAIVVGPPIMYKYVILKLLEKKIPEHQIILSLERRMKCGLGRCGHCQMNESYVCKDGPTFRYNQIKCNEEAL